MSVVTQFRSYKHIKQKNKQVNVPKRVVLLFCPVCIPYHYIDIVNYHANLLVSASVRDLEQTLLNISTMYQVNADVALLATHHLKCCTNPHLSCFCFLKKHCLLNSID